MKRRTSYLRATLILGIVILASPEASYACEKCFGAAADSPTVQAIGASMFGLLMMITFVFGGVFSFFNRAHTRGIAIAEGHVTIDDDGTMHSTTEPTDLD